MSEDTISRRATIEAIFNEPLCESGMKERTAIAVVLAIYKKIKSLPSAQPEPQWIPVTKRLPNREEYIRCNGLFIVSDGDRTYAEYFDIYDKKCFGEPVMHGFRADRAVTAWMPLPEPYAERRTNE